MSEKNIKARLQQKHDTSANWALATNFKPKAGELIIYDDLKKMKVGDGETLVNNLPFLSADVSQDLNNYVKLTTDQTISGIKTFNAPTNVSGKETITTKFKTSNGGALIIGKEGSNSGTMLRFDQVDGTCRLRFRGSATAGAMVWEQPEKNAALYFDMGNSAGSGVNRVTLRNEAGTLALTKELPAAVSANPTLSGSETVLTGLQIGSTKYKIPSGGGGGGGDVTAAGNNTFTGSNSFTSGINIVESDNDKTTYSCGHIANYTQSGSYTLYLPSKNGIVATTDDIPVPNDTTGSTSTSTLTSLRFGNKTYKPKSLYKHHLKLELYEKKGSSSSLKGYLYVVLWNSSSTKTQLNPLIISELKNSPAFFTTSSLTTPADGGPVWVFEAAYTTTGSSGYIYNIYLSGVKVQSNTGTPSPVFYLSHSSSADKLEIKRVVSDTIYSQ